MALPQEHLLDELATAYVQAIVAAAGATIAVTRLDYGVDGTLKHVQQDNLGRFVETGYPVDFQLKGTTVATVEQDFVRYDLKARNFDLIVTRTETATPYYLFLVCFGGLATNWWDQQNDHLILNASAFWWTRMGKRTENKTSTGIHVPTGNRLTAEAIEYMLIHSKERFLS